MQSSRLEFLGDFSREFVKPFGTELQVGRDRTCTVVVSGLYGVSVVFPSYAGMADCRAELERRGGTCGELQEL